MQSDNIDNGHHAFSYHVCVRIAIRNMQMTANINQLQVVATSPIKNIIMEVVETNMHVCSYS